MRPVDDRAATATIGTVLMLAVTFFLASAVFAVAWEAKRSQGTAPRGFSFDPDASSRSLKVLVAPRGASWAELRVEGCTTVPSGVVDPGDEVSGCAGQVHVYDRKANRRVATFLFD